MFAAAAVTLLTTVAPAQTQGWGIREQDFSSVIQQVVQMPFDPNLVQRTNALGLNVVNLMWEDTGRYENSAVGPNISDLTLQVRQQTRDGVQTHLLPVIRHPNFSDKTGDIPADKLWVRVGNHKKGGKLEAVPLMTVIKNLHDYMSTPSELVGSDDLGAARDTHFLVSAQHVFLPLPATGKVEFNPVLYNYQSSPGRPAVLTLLVTREGTSVRVIDNAGGDQSYQGWGQQLFHNHGGQRTAFTAERKSAVKARIERQGEVGSDKGALEEGADMMMIVQIPLLVEQPRRYAPSYLDTMGAAEMAPSPATAAPQAKASRRAGSDVEQAVLGHGEEMGRFAEVNGLRVQRDARFPIRVTVQFYKATSNGVVSDQDLADVSRSIEKVYASADYVGSLVVPQSERKRPTDWLKGRNWFSWK